MASKTAVCDTAAVMIHGLWLTMREMGYRWGAPTPEALLADRATYAEEECPVCEHLGLSVEPYHKAGSYRAFAVCPACGATQEV